MKSQPDARSSFHKLGLVPLLVAAALSHSAAALLQNWDQIKAGLEVWRSSGCADCHGPFADGNPEDGDYPIAANLRTTRLD
jgi:mono/diheme cytochrome c family protein